MRKGFMVSALIIAAVGLALAAQAKPRIYKWVKDKRVSSEDVLRKPQFSRVISLSEARTEEVVRSVMTDDLYLSLAKYHTTKHQQDAETTADSVLPEEVVRQQEIDLIDEDYRFILEVKTKAYGNRTRLTAKVWPVYRLRDFEAEEARDDDGSTTSTSVEVKVKANRLGAVALGPIIVAPILGLPSDYGITPLPDAGQRAGEIVKSFMYFLDQRVKETKPVQAPAVATQPEAAPPAEITQPAAPEAATGGEEEGTIEVDINVQHNKK